MTRTIVIGGGIAGLATAALLAREGHKVTLVEQNAELGGRAGSWERDGFRFDTGPSWYLMPEVFDHFYRILGTTAEQQLDLVQLDPGYRVYGEGHADPLDVSASVEENLELFERVEKGSAIKLAKYLDRAREIYDLAKERFLYSTFQRLGPVFGGEVTSQGARLMQLLLEPLDSLTKRTVRDTRLRQILGYPAVFLGSAPKLAPSMYSLMSHLDLVDGVFYPLGGFTRVIETIAGLARAQGADLQTSTTVKRIVVNDAGAVTGVEVTHGTGKKAVMLDADVVVSTADLHHTETVLVDRPELRTYPQEYWDKRTAGPGALLILLGVSGELPQLEHHTLFFAKDWNKGFAAIFGSHPRIPDTLSLYVCKPSGVDSGVAPEGTENLFVLVPLPADPSIGRGGIDGAGDASVEALADRVIAQIGDWAGIPDLASRVVLRRTVAPGDFAADLNSWKGSALGPAHTLRQSAFFRAGDVSRKVKNLFYAGSSTIPGVGLPMCLISAELVLKRVRGDTSAHPVAESLRVTRATS
ncbi:MAG TPA: phytoene desaturase family protein [Pseudolysinimonas sp.]|nr:phytoene desaturase family protein [Pseudolysinimonas sp.]